MSAGDPVVQGAVNDAVDATTTLTAKFSGTTLVVNNTMGSSGSHVGAIEATVAWGNGIVGTSTEGNGITGHGPNGNGVVGTTNVGFGVLGSADTAGGVGVVANSATATDTYGILALDVRGPARFRRCGVVQVPAGHSHATVTGLAIFPYTSALATCQAAAGVGVPAAVPHPAEGELEIVLDHHAPAGGMPVFWMLVEHH